VAAPRRLVLQERDLHLWLSSRKDVTSSDGFKRAVLSRYTGVAPERLRFAEGEHGKPALEGIAGTLQFNLSHSGDWLACAVTAAAPVGVDLELCNPDRVSLRVARRYFRAVEADLLDVSEGDLRAQRFYDFWTLKEAAVKARGEALAPGLSAHGFGLAYPDAQGSVTGRITATVAAAADPAHYILLDPLPDYRMALCWLGPAHLSPRLHVYELLDGSERERSSVALRARSMP